MTKKQKKQPMSLLKKVVIGIFLVPILLILSLAILLTAWDMNATRQDKRELTAAVREIQLPANYGLFQTDFTDFHCLDVCANMVLHYRSRDGKPLDREVVDKEVERLGYSSPDRSPGYEYLGREFRNGEKGLSIRQQNAPPEYLTLMISK